MLKIISDLFQLNCHYNLNTHSTTGLNSRYTSSTRQQPFSILISCSLTDVLLDEATARGDGGVASNVEQCDCPSNYAGTSCERCAGGYFRVRRGPYIGVCVPCECNGRASSCDPETGECLVSLSMKGA